METSNQSETTNNNTTITHNLAQRRSSVPIENLSLVSNNGSFNNKNRARKKILRRRSSGGAEILSPIQADSSESSGTPWYKFKKDINRKTDIDALLSRRRGSLPVEVFAVCHTG